MIGEEYRSTGVQEFRSSGVQESLLKAIPMSRTKKQKTAKAHLPILQLL
jgi:hypothetical protein